MSKTKTKRARRELKREGNRKIAEHHRKAAKVAESKQLATKPPAKKPKTQGAATKDAPAAAAKPAHVQSSQKKHAIPFGEYDHILLVGEGDFSFTRSLAVEHGCANITGTSYDSLSDVQSKYPTTFSDIASQLADLTPPVPLHHSIDATKLSSYKHLRCKRDDDDSNAEEKEGWDMITFMFPHTGGLSTHVNRQVRANQALLVNFFKSCLDTPTPKRRLQMLQNQKKEKNNNNNNKNNKLTSSTPQQRQQQQQQQQQEQIKPPFLRMGGKIIVTLFEGEPYTLWNIKDVARHAGLKVVESRKFDWDQYPGYHHVRTLGALQGGGAWKGEDRAARMYVFEKIPLVPDSDEEREMARLDKVGRGGRLVSQKEAARRAMEEQDEEEEEEDEEEDEDEEEEEEEEEDEEDEK